MHRQPIIQLIEQYVANRPEQASEAERMLKLINQHEDCFERTCIPGHITGSAWVVSHDWQKHLLLHHRKLNKWLQPGGHADGQTEVAEVALREATEESGLNDLQVVTSLEPAGMMDLDVHKIPARYSPKGELIDPEHEHHDLRFLIRCPTDQQPIVSEESNEVRWFSESEVRSLTDELSVLRLLDKANHFRQQTVNS